MQNRRDIRDKHLWKLRETLQKRAEASADAPDAIDVSSPPLASPARKDHPAARSRQMAVDAFSIFTGALLIGALFLQVGLALGWVFPGR